MNLSLKVPRDQFRPSSFRSFPRNHRRLSTALWWPLWVSLSTVRTNNKTTVLTRAMSSTTVTTTTTPPQRPVPVAAVAQLRSTSNKFQNLLDVASCARMAKHAGASMLFLPECFGFMGDSSDQTLSEAEDPTYIMDHDVGGRDNHNEGTVTDAIMAALQEENDSDDSSTTNSGSIPQVRSLLDGLRTIAIGSGLWISCGGIHVAGAPPDPETDSPRVYNTHIIMDDAGVVQCSYRKIHLFDVSIPGRVQLRESKTTAPGTELVVCDSPIGKLGISTCYDVRFPEMYIPLVQRGAQILLVPSAFTVPTGAAHWHTLLKARAIESQCYVLAAAQYGRHNEKRESFGHALAVSPWGKVLADAGGYPLEGEDGSNVTEQPPEPPSIVTVEIDLLLVESIRQRIPIDLHRSTAPF